ncbi:5-hydroxytryptamine receptor 2B isoform X2 [Ahaetulla prasina]|uniref:5-hydroxytryptamine receptor 2B isoform X2 n=1 Tax=Ahaetulla prasina TaxID=499056 RepID=UPI00264900E8|nr:5-hydroxytryptamine receptor 2B isoform X2 [Ahaetulla prasina]
MLLPLNASDLRNGSLQINSGEWNTLRWAGLLTLIVIIPTIGGNILVILAVSLEKKLQYATNYFLMSLAVADLLVGLFVMPIALLTLLFGIAIPIPIRGIEENGANFPNFTCVLKPNRFGDFILYGSIAAFFVPLAIMVVSYFLTIRVLHRKAYLINKPPQRLTWNTISTVFQREMTAGSSPEKMAMLDGSRKDRVLPNGNEEMLIRRMSAVGKKSVQSITNEQRASKVLGIVFFLFLVMWCPFFITNITSVLCKSCSEEFIQMLMEIFVWIGYVSSGVNPLVYTLFNKTFREAFGRYITCNYQTSAAGTASRKASARLSFRNSVTENSKLFMMHHGRRNGVNPVGYPNHRLCSSPIQSSSAVLLDTLLLTEHEVDKTEEQASYV